MGEKWNTWEIWGKIGILAKNLGKIGILAKNWNSYEKFGKKWNTCEKIGKNWITWENLGKMWFLEYILIFFSIVLPGFIASNFLKTQMCSIKKAKNQKKNIT
jgi:hypothetical protein